MKKQYTATDRLITRITGWLAGCMVLILLVWGIRTLWRYHRYEQTDDAQVEEYVNPVISRAGGFITQVRFEENQSVHRGDTLLLIDSREYSIQQEQTEAAISKAEAQLQVLSANARTLEKAAQAAQAQIRASQAKVWKQKLDYDRYQKMYKDEAATAQQMENIQATLDVYQSEYTSAQENYDAARSKTADVLAEQAVARAEVRRLKALLDRHKLDVSYTAVIAPYDGRMGRRTVEPGQMINAGEVLAYIVDDETDKWIVANYKETQVAHIHIGDSAQVVADAWPAHPFRGTVISVSPATGSSFSLLPPDNATGNYVKIVQRIPVRIRIEGSKAETGLLKAGMNANIYIRKGQKHE